MSAKHRMQIAADLEQYSQLTRAGLAADLVRAVTHADGKSTTSDGGRSGDLTELLRKQPELVSKIESLTDHDRAELAQAAARALLGVSSLSGTSVVTATTLTVMSGVLGLMVFFVFPELQNIYGAEGAELPLVTRLAIGFGSWVLFPVLVLVSVAWSTGPLGARMGGQWARVAVLSDTWFDRLAPLRRQRRTHATRVLAHWLAATTGVLSPAEALTCLVELLGPGWFTRHLARLLTDISAGTALHDSLGKGPWLPGLAMVMEPATATRSGLQAYEASLELRVDDASGRLVVWWKFALAAFVGFFVVAMYSAIFMIASGF